jgi:hypothetical protein
VDVVLEENAMANLKDASQLSATAAMKAERALDKAAAMREYEAEQLALAANTARLRALRLAREAQSASETANAPIPIKTPAKKKAAAPAAVAKLLVSKRAAGKASKLA